MTTTTTTIAPLPQTDPLDAVMLITQANEALARARSIPEVKQIRDQAAAIRDYFDQQRYSLQTQNHAAAIKVRAERRLGELTAEMEKNKGGLMAGRDEIGGYIMQPPNSAPTYADMGFNKVEAFRWQEIASIPEPVFESHLAETLASDDELTSSGLHKLAKEIKRAADLKDIKDSLTERSLDPGVDLYDVILLDPPWPYGTEYDSAGRRAANPYPEMSLDEIQAITIPATENATLWLWTTHKFLPESFGLIEQWGFDYKVTVTWVKDRMGLGQYLRSQSEFLLLATKSKPTLTLTNQTTVIYGPLREHSRKPDSSYELIETLCPGAKVEFFQREARESWHGVGAEVGREF